MVGWLGVLAGGIVGVAPARADVTGSYDGNLTARKLGQPVATAAVLSQTGKAVTGTLVVPGDPTAFGGAYLVTGRTTAKRLMVSGTIGGARIVWRPRIAGTTLQGPVRLKGAGRKIAGTIALTQNPPLGDGTACDGVFTQNQPFFVDEVLANALSSCTACHVSGGQAQATRFRVTPGDPLATARAVASLVDSANPAASRILEKPTAVLPHGGGQQIVPGSPPELTLRQWVDLVAQGHCN
jgi:hypothetical protein